MPILWANLGFPLGFFDLVVLEHDTEVNKVFFLSFWETKKNAEYYEKEFYPKVKAIIEQFFTTPPVVKYYTLDETFSEKSFTKIMVKIRSSELPRQMPRLPGPFFSGCSAPALALSPKRLAHW